MTDEAKEALRVGLQRWTDDRFGPGMFTVRIGPREPEPEPGPGEYRCGLCGDIFDKAWSDEEASAEAEENFPGLMGADPEDRAAVCDDCYRLMAQQMSMPTPLMAVNCEKGDDQC